MTTEPLPSPLMDVTSLLGKLEELDPELVPHLSNGHIRHPLVYSLLHFPQLNAVVNAQLRAKKEALAQARSEQAWESFIWLHERPYRVNAFVAIQRLMTDEEYWHYLGAIWIDSENIRQSPGIWQELLRSERPNREAIMDDDERQALAAMPNLIQVYQGHTKKAHDGWSWTTDKAKAEWFARRFSEFEHSAPMVTKGVVYKRNVIAYFTGRNESEIVVPRRFVIERSTRLAT